MWDPSVFHDPPPFKWNSVVFLCIFLLFFFLFLISTMPLQGPSGWAGGREGTLAFHAQLSLQQLQFRENVHTLCTGQELLATH